MGANIGAFCPGCKQRWEDCTCPPINTAVGDIDRVANELKGLITAHLEVGTRLALAVESVNMAVDLFHQEITDREKNGGGHG